MELLLLLRRQHVLDDPANPYSSNYRLTLDGDRSVVGARVLLLLFHLMQRTIQVIWVYTPGESYLTPHVGSIKNDTCFARTWGACNAAIVMVVFTLVL